MATLTAILCNYNHARYVSRAIEAMLSQSRPPDQLVIVDDGSTDGSGEIIRGWAERSPAILFLQNEQNRGFHASSARALAAATGDYIYSGAADDYVLPGFFEAVCGALDVHPQSGVACARMVKQSADGQRICVDGFQHLHETCYVAPADFLRVCLESEPATHSLSSATVYRHAALQAVGGWRRELGPWADTFAIRAVGLRTGLCYVPQEGTVWVVHSTGMSQSTLHDPAAAVRMVECAARLMRTPEFQGTFPESHVRRWQSDYVTALVGQQFQSRRAATLGKAGGVIGKLAALPRFTSQLARLAFAVGPVRFISSLATLSGRAVHRRLMPGSD